MSTANGNGNGSGDWKSWLLKQGVSTVLLVTLAVWVANYLLLPMRDSQKQLTDSNIQANLKHADAAVINAVANQARAVSDAAIADHMKDTRQILQQIRDDQRNGAWNHSPKQ